MRISSTDRSVQQGTPLLGSTVSIENVEYSPDGFWLLYEGDETGKNNDIYYMTVTGASRTRLTFDEGLDFDPAWRPFTQ
jgi:Tol biopolymer transport system component